MTSTIDEPILEDVLLGVEDVYEEIGLQILKARKTIYASMFGCNFLMPLLPERYIYNTSSSIVTGRSLTDLLLYACKTNPDLQVYLLINENDLVNHYPDENPFYFNTHPQIHIRYIPMYNKPFPFFQLYTFTNIFIGAPRFHGINCLHQKYWMFDEEHILFGGTDLIREYLSNYTESHSPNRNSWYWYDITLLWSNLPSYMAKFFRKNYESGTIGVTLTKDGSSVPIPYPLTNGYADGPLNEPEWYVYMIERAQRFVYMEHQYCYSSSSSKNGVLRALKKRLIRAYEEDDPHFVAVIVTNYFLENEPNNLNKLGIRAMLAKSLADLFFVSSKHRQFFRERVLISYLQRQNDLSHIYVHCKYLCVDNQNAIVSSANLCDRSMSRGTTDTELGWVIHERPDTVRRIHEKVLQLHLPEGYSSKDDDILETVVKETRERSASTRGAEGFGSFRDLLPLLDPRQIFRGRAFERFNHFVHFL